MTAVYNLAIGQRSYSSWSLRAWLLLEHFNLPYQVTYCRIYDPSFQAALAPFAPARTVPALLTPEGDLVVESLAIAEELASRHPELGIWPAAPKARARARTIAAEMHAGFQALRNACPHNLRFTWQGFQPSEAVLADLARIEQLWAWARELSDGKGPWLFGSYSAADAFYAPVAGRIAGYRLPVGPEAQAYVAAHLADPAYRRWREEGLRTEGELEQYEQHLPRGDWPEPAE